MTRRASLTLAVLIGAVLFGAPPHRARAQISLADDLILLTKIKHQQEQEKTHQHLVSPGQGESPFRTEPGALRARLGEPVSVTTSPSPLAGVARQRPTEGGGAPPRILPPAPLPRTTARTVPQAALELPTTEDEGPPDGLTLDAAIDLLVKQNLDLQVKFREIPKAQADILSAGLRNNPLIFASVDNVPYGSYSPQRPGETSYSATLIQAIDVNRKRLNRIAVARAAQRVLEAQYQDAVRLEIDNLGIAYVEALAARTAVRAARVGVDGLRQLADLTRGLAAKGVQPKIEIDRVLIQQANAEIALRAAEANLLQKKRTLALLLHLPPEQVASLTLRGSLRVPGLDFPCVADLVHAALAARPDLAAYQLGVRRAVAEVGLARKEAVTDVFVLYNPYTFTNNAPTGGRNATSWGISAMVSLPVFNRNQGNITRAEVNVAQTRLEVTGVERKVIAEVHEAAQELALTQASLRKQEEQVLPAARRVKDAIYRLYASGQESLQTFLAAQRDYNEQVQQYLDTLVRHRRNQLRLNTVVGQRVLP